MDLTKKRYLFYIRIGINLNALGTLESREGQEGQGGQGLRQTPRENDFLGGVWRKPCPPCPTFQRA